MKMFRIMSPDATLIKIAKVVQEEQDYQIDTDKFSVCNLGIVYIYKNENMFIFCYNYFETQKQLVVVVSYLGDTPYVWFSDFLED